MVNTSRAISSLLAVTFVLSSQAEPVSTASLLHEMVDMERLVELPDPPYKTVQFSSYDRRSRIPGGPFWFGNSDGFGNEPTPNFEEVLVEPGDDGIGEYLVCDARGPGAIVRTWTAKHNGEYRVYLDGSSTPLYEGPAEAFLLCPYEAMRQGGTLDVDAGLLQATFRQNMAGFCPIPFAKRCRIEWRGRVEHVHFYQIQMRKYAPDTNVTTFSADDLTGARTTLERTARILANPSRAYPLEPSRPAGKIAATVPPATTREILAMAGPAALGQLTIKAYAADVACALRQTVLKIHFDEHSEPQVESPLGDFFGAAPGINPYDSLPFTVSPDGTMTCRFVMPFAKSARVVVENHGDQVVTLSGSAQPIPYEWDADRSCHFRARWRVDHDVVGDPHAVQDMPYVCADGRGRFVGAALMLLNPVPVATSWGSWWGEGDEKIFVDDDVTPSTFGTGSEDYFNYAWGSPDIFGFAYCGQPRNDGPGNRGFVTNQRWQIIDDLPFFERLAFYMELYPHRRTPGMSYARIGYYYATPATTDDHVRVTGADVRTLRLPTDWRPVAEFGLEGATIVEAEAVARPIDRVKRCSDPIWSGGESVAWYPKASAERLELVLTVPSDGDYTLHMALGLHERAGRVRFGLDGRPIAFRGGVEHDLHVPHRVLSRMFVSEKRALTVGEHVVTLEFVGGPADAKAAEINVDFIGIKPERP